MTNCKNCGAPLHSGKCEYCGTEYKTEYKRETNLHPPDYSKFIQCCSDSAYLKFIRDTINVANN